MSWPGGADWLFLFMEYLIKTSLSLSIALLLVSMYRSRPASIRHFVLSFFLIGLLLLPVFSELKFGWETNLLPSRSSMDERMGIANQPALSETEPSAGSTSISTKGGLNPTGSHNSSGRHPQAHPFLSQAATTRKIADAVLPLIWSAGSIILLLRLALGILGAYRLTQEGENVADPAWRILLARFLAALRLGRSVRLKSHGEIAVPLTWGLFRPVVLIPAGHEKWTEDQRSSALLHELSHIKRADFLVMLLARLSLAVFWFNPLTWVVFRLLKKEQERSCDELVLAAGIKPSAYAATLLFFKRSSGNRIKASPAFLRLLGGASFNDRLAAILKETLIFREIPMKTKITSAILVILSVALIGMARPSKVPSEAPLELAASPTAAPDAFSIPPLRTVIAATDVEQEKKPEAQAAQDRKKDEQKRTIVIANKEGKKVPIEITIMTDDQVKKIQVEKSITIKEGKEGELILLDPEGKELQVLKGDRIRLTVGEKDLVLLKEGKTLKIAKEGASGLVAGKGEGDAKSFTFYVTPRVKLQDIKANVIVRKPLTIQMSEDRAASLNKKLQELRVKLNKEQMKEPDIAELKIAIQEIEKELAKQEAGDRVAIRVRENPQVYSGIKVGESAKGEGRATAVRPSGRNFITLKMDRGMTISIEYGLEPGENSRAVHERIVDRVKKELPEGYSMESAFDEKSGTITLKETGKAIQKESGELVKKLVDIIKAEIK